MMQRNMKPAKVLIIGLGRLGLPVAKYVKEMGFEIFGFDANVEAVERAKRMAGIKRAQDFDAYIICISTHSPDDIFLPNIEGVISIADRISKEAKKDGALVSIESTVPKGTSRKVFELLNHRLHVVHAPHRWYALEEKEHGVNQLRVIGGVSDCCLKAGMWFYSGSKGSFAVDRKQKEVLSITYTSYHGLGLGVPMYMVSNAEIAETTKVVENAHRYLQMLFAEEPLLPRQ